MRDLINYAYEIAVFGEYDTKRGDCATINKLNDDLIVRLITQTDITVEVVYQSELVLRAVNPFYGDEFIVEHYQAGSWEDALADYYYG